MYERLEASYVYQGLCIFGQDPIPQRDMASTTHTHER